MWICSCTPSGILPSVLASANDRKQGALSSFWCIRASNGHLVMPVGVADLEKSSSTG